ncbi:MAG: hypothetical protein ACO1TE_17030 [Prosthecobacter sp.]
MKRTDSAVFTEEVAKIAANTGRMAESLEVIKLQNEIERLDREHAAEHTQAKITPGGKVAGGCIGTVFLVMFTSFGIFFAVSSGKAGAPVIFQVVGGGFALIGIIALFGMLKQFATREDESKEDAHASDYQQRRTNLAQKLAELTKT